MNEVVLFDPSLPPVRTFQGEYRFLSNFWKTTVVFEDLTYYSTEAAFQAAKTTDLMKRLEFVMHTDKDTGKTVMTTASQTKTMGKLVRLRDDWDDVKLDVMYRVNMYKYTHDDLLRRKLFNTGMRELIEGNEWQDTYWGVCNDFGDNHLGKILMRVRYELSNNLTI